MKSQEIEMEIIATESEMRRFKKTRRGKKRRLKPFTEDVAVDGNSTADNCPQQLTESEEHATEEVISTTFVPLIKNSDPLDLETQNEETLAHRSLSIPHWSGVNHQRILRPLEVPKAPSNSTQFIMDDHENCNLYVSFESPSRYKRLRRSSGTSSEECCTSPCLGYHDINYEYESPDDLLDITAFFEKDFEMTYRRAREEELITLPRGELISQLIELEEKANRLEQVLNGNVPSVALLQEGLLKLQEENAVLRKSNLFLRGEDLLTDDDDYDDDDDDEEEEESATSNSSVTEHTVEINNISATTTNIGSANGSESDECDDLNISTENKKDDLEVNVT